MSKTEDYLVHISLNPERKKKDPKYAGWTLQAPTRADVKAAERRGEEHLEKYHAQQHEYLSGLGISPLNKTDTRTNRDRKKCPVCGRTRELKFFAKSPYGFGGRIATCKSCVAAKRMKTRNKNDRISK